MKSRDITDYLMSTIGKYITIFNGETLAVTSITSTSGIATLISAAPHNLSTNDKILINGVQSTVQVASIVRNNSIVTVTTATQHYLPNPLAVSSEYASQLTVTIQGAVPNEYNGTYKLLSSPTKTTFTFRINTTPITPATTNGEIVIEDFYQNYNGIKTATVVDATTITYPVYNPSLPTTGVITLQHSPNVVPSTVDRMLDFYKEANNANRETKPYLFVTLGDNVASKDGINANDQSVKQENATSYHYECDQDFVIHAVLPSKTDEGDETGGDVMDTAKHEVLYALIKSLANANFNSPFATNAEYQGVTFTGNSTFSFGESLPYFVEAYNFSARVRIQEQDTAELNGGVPLVSITNDYEDKNINNISVVY